MSLTLYQAHSMAVGGATFLRASILNRMPLVAFQALAAATAVDFPIRAAISSYAALRSRPHFALLWRLDTQGGQEALLRSGLALTSPLATPSHHDKGANPRCVEYP